MKTEPEKPAEAGRLEAGTGRNPPLDHASARIVSELAARLLPPLKEELSALRTLEDEEKDAAWRRIREAVSELAARPRVEPEGDPAHWEALARSLEDTNRRIALLEGAISQPKAAVENIAELQRAPASSHPDSSPSNGVGAPFPPEREAPLLDLMENRIPIWEGLLRAHNQAQSRELNALSVELAELQNETREAMARTLREALEQELADCGAQWSRRLEALRNDMRAMQKRLWCALGLAMPVLISLSLLLARILGKR
nr:hypothetical protein [uncultured Fretibacterium sp.]